MLSIKESVAQLSSRLERAEGTTQLDRSSLAAVVNQAKALEQTLIQTHGELKGNQSQQSAQLQEMRTELNEMNATHNRMESLVYNLADDLRELRSAANMQFMQFQTTTAELKQKTDKISHDNKKVADKIRAHQASGRFSRAYFCCILMNFSDTHSSVSLLPLPFLPLLPGHGCPK